MMQVNSDVVEFNSYVKNSLKGLQSRGEKTEDLIINLFKGYKAAKDAIFVDYITCKEDDYEEGTPYTPERLMRKALNKYSIRKSKLIWGALSPEQQDIVSLNITVLQLKDQNLCLKKDLTKRKPGQPKSRLSGGAPSAQKGRLNGKPSKKKKDE
eukprot:9397662-Ditylum_brightwellii.AAC.1